LRERVSGGGRSPESFGVSIRMKYGFNFIFALFLFAWGLSCICFPQWWYKKVSSDQMARDRRRFQMLGYILTPVGVVALLLALFVH
jgi:hypothetical protein